MIGKRIVVTSWATLGVFAAVAIPFALGLDALKSTAVAVSLVLFLASLPIWIYAFGKVLVRSTQGDEIAVASWVFLTPSAPKDMRNHLLGATGVCIWWRSRPRGPIRSACSYRCSNSVLAALWGARYGTYPARRSAAPTKGARR